MSLIKVANTTRPPVVPVRIPAPKVIGAEASDAGGTFHVISLDQLKVVEGVYRREVIKSSDELILGDEFQVPETEGKFRASCFTEAGLTSVEVVTGSRFGPSSFIATVTHTVIFMSESGKQLSGYVLNGSGNAANRPSIILGGETISSSRYSLIDISVGHKDLGWSDTIGADGDSCASVPDYNITGSNA